MVFCFHIIRFLLVSVYLHFPSNLVSFTATASSVTLQCSALHLLSLVLFVYLFCFVLFCFVLFCFVLFCFVLFCSVLFCFLFCFVLFCFVFLLFFSPPPPFFFLFFLFCFSCSQYLFPHLAPISSSFLCSDIQSKRTPSPAVSLPFWLALLECASVINFGIR